MKLDTIDHIAITVTDIKVSVDWYLRQYHCQVLYQDNTWALLEYHNIKLALVIDREHPPHFAIISETPEQYGPLTKHRDRSQSVYIEDPDGNHIEMIRYES
ncbi:MAG: VOC family protein [Gammaproteobacteria bacterium]|nr:VOC family protein [Gammaproteobacteria bacterium]